MGSKHGFCEIHKMIQEHLRTYHVAAVLEKLAPPPVFSKHCILGHFKPSNALKENMCTLRTKH